MTEHAVEETNSEEMLQDVLSGRQVAFTVSGAIVTHDPLPTVLAHPGQLAVMFGSLVDNALKFRESDSPTVHLRKEMGAGESVRTNSS
jgi:light-regulated signal transduction histidine kinase (bacteriophytochrome)